MTLSKHKPFYISVFGGILVWLILFLMFPASIVTPFSKEAFLFILISYIVFVIGYFVLPKSKKKHNSNYSFAKKSIYLVIGICIISFTVRYIDLFVFRGVSFKFSVWENRALLEMKKPNFIFILASVIKQAYFIPVILVFREGIKDKKLYSISIFLFLLPLIEGYIRGSRNTFFIATILLFIIMLYFNKIKFIKKHIIIILTTVSILFIIATSIIMNRERKNADANYTNLTKDFVLNTFLKPNNEVFNLLETSESDTFKKFFVSSFQIFQYYVHGIFEFDNLVKHYQENKFKPQYGKYTFFTINRFTNQYGITNTDLEAVQLTHPRGYTFLTFFGCLYLDFGWLGIIVMFFYGMFQRYLANKILNKQVIFLPLFIFLVFCNFFMLTFNFVKNTGTYIIIVCLLFSFGFSIYNKFKTTEL